MNFKKVCIGALAGTMVLGMGTFAYADADVSYNAPYTITSADFDAKENPTITITGYGTEGTDAAYWNDWCAVGIEITVNGETSYKAVGGAQVTWAISFTEDKLEEVSAADVQKVDDNKSAIVKLGKLEGDWSVKVRSMGWDNAADCAYVKVDTSNVGTAKGASSGDKAPIAYMMGIAAVAGLAMAATKMKRA